MKRILIGLLLVILTTSYIVQYKNVIEAMQKKEQAVKIENVENVENVENFQKSKKPKQKDELLAYPPPPDNPLPPYPVPDNSPIHTPLPPPAPRLTPTLAPTMNPLDD